MNFSDNPDKDKGSESAPDYKLFTIAQVGIACFFATPFTALLMIALNFRAFGETRSFKLALVLAIILLPVLLMFLNEMADRRTYRILIFVVAAVMAYVAKTWQGDLYREHFESGGERKSIWHVIGVIILGVVVIYWGLIVYGFLRQIGNG
jgi:hypothetical protein